MGKNELQVKTTDEELILGLYQRMYQAMIEKDMQVLDQLHGEDFQLRHMTGLRQGKREYLASIENGDLNYFGKTDDAVRVQVTGDTAELTGQSRVSAAVFGGGTHTWRLQLRFTLRRGAAGWQLTGAEASTY